VDIKAKLAKLEQEVNQLTVQKAKLEQQLETLQKELAKYEAELTETVGTNDITQVKKWLDTTENELASIIKTLEEQVA